MSKRILFVDDEPLVLSGLERSLHSMRKDWEIVSVTSGEQALQVMAGQPFDIVVADLKMPGMTGAQLLEEIKREFPRCLRIILTSHTDSEVLLKAIGSAHQFIAKPCEGSQLRNRLLRAFVTRDLLENSDLKNLLSRLNSLPTLPSLYLELTNEINKDDPSISKISQLVASDLAATARILQLANSPLFGLRTQVSNASQAVRLLGLDTVRALVLSSQVFTKFKAKILGEADLMCLWQHSIATAANAKKIALLEKADQRFVDDSFTAALLHDVGKLALASMLPEKYEIVLSTAKRDGAGLAKVENEILGCNHAGVGAYLLGLWGLPDRIVDAVAWHISPSLSMQSEFSPLAAVHVASICHEEHSPSWLRDGMPLDECFLGELGFADKVKQWRSALEMEAQGEVVS